MSINGRKKVLIIDDEVDLCLLLKTYLIKRNFEVYYTHTLNEGKRKFNLIKPDILFLDNNLPDGTGWGEVPEFLSANPELQLHLISAYHPDHPNPRGNFFKIWEKPLTLKELDNLL